MNFLDIAPENTSVALEQISTQVALEALSVSSVVNRVADLVPDLVHSAKMFLGDKNKDKPSLSSLSVNPSTLSKALTPTTFTNLASLNHPVPAGFKGNLYEYTVVLKQALIFASDAPAIITDFNVFLSQMISSEQARKSIRSDVQIFRDRTKTRKELINATTPFFSAGSRINNARYGDVIGSNAQYLQFVDLVQELLQISSAIKLSHVETLVQDCHELLSSLSENAAGNQLSGLSPQMLEMIGLATDSVARDIEYYSLTLWALSGLREATQKGAESLIKALRY